MFFYLMGSKLKILKFKNNKMCFELILLNLSFVLINFQLWKKIIQEKLVYEYLEFMYKF